MKGPSIRALLQASAVTSLLLAAPPGNAQGAHPEGEKVELSPEGVVEVPGTSLDLAREHNRILCLDAVIAEAGIVRAKAHVNMGSPIRHSCVFR